MAAATASPKKRPPRKRRRQPESYSPSASSGSESEGEDDEGEPKAGPSSPPIAQSISQPLKSIPPASEDSEDSEESEDSDDSDDSEESEDDSETISSAENSSSAKPAPDANGRAGASNGPTAPEVSPPNQHRRQVLRTSNSPTPPPRDLPSFASTIKDPEVEQEKRTRFRRVYMDKLVQGFGDDLEKLRAVSENTLSSMLPYQQLMHGYSLIPRCLVNDCKI